MSMDAAPPATRRLAVPDDGGEVAIDLAASDAVELVAGRPRPVSLIAEGAALRIDLGHHGSVVLHGYFGRPAGDTPLRMSGRAFPAPHVTAMLERARQQGRLGDDGLTAALDAEGLHLELADWMFAPAGPAPAPATGPAAALEPAASAAPNFAGVPGVVSAAAVAAGPAESFAEPDLGDEPIADPVLQEGAEPAPESAALDAVEDRDLAADTQPQPAAEPEPDAGPVADTEVVSEGTLAWQMPAAAAAHEAPLAWQEPEDDTAAEPDGGAPLGALADDSDSATRAGAAKDEDEDEVEDGAVVLPTAAAAAGLAGDDSGLWDEPAVEAAPQGDAQPSSPPVEEAEDSGAHPLPPPLPGYQPMVDEGHWAGDAEASEPGPGGDEPDWRPAPDGPAGDWAEPPLGAEVEADDLSNREFLDDEAGWSPLPAAAAAEPAFEPAEPPPSPSRMPAADAAALAPDQMFELPEGLRPGTAVEGELLEHRPGPAARLLITGNLRTALGGSVRLHADGRFAYEPPRMLGPGERDGFAYRVGDEATEARGLVSLVAPGPQPANTLALTGAEDLELVVDAAAGLLAGVVPGAERVQSIGTVLTDRGGSADVEAEGGFHYLPPAGFVGVDRFDCAVETDSGDVVTATVAVTVAQAPAPSPPPQPRAEPDAAAEERAQQGAVGREYSIPVPHRAGVGSRVQLLLEPLAPPEGIDIAHVVLEHYDGDTWRPFDSGDSVPVVEPGDALLVRVIAIDSRGRAVRRSLIQAHFQMGEIVNPIGEDAPEDLEATAVPDAPAGPAPGVAPVDQALEDAEPPPPPPPPPPPLPPPELEVVVAPEDVFLAGALSDDEPAGAAEAAAMPALPLAEQGPSADQLPPDGEPVAVVRRIAPGVGEGVLVELDIPLPVVPRAAQRHLIHLVDASAPDEPPPLALQSDRVSVYDGDDWVPLDEDHTAEVPAGAQYARVRVIDADPDLVHQLTHPDGLVMRADPVDEDELMLTRPAPGRAAGWGEAAEDDDVLVLDTPVTDDTEVVTDADDAMPPLMIGPALVAGETVALAAAAAAAQPADAADADEEPADEEPADEEPADATSAEAIARAISAVSLEKTREAAVPFGLLAVPADGAAVSQGVPEPDEVSEDDAATILVIAANAPDILYAEDDLDARMGLRSTSSLFEDFGDPWLDITLTPDELTLAASGADAAASSAAAPAVGADARLRAAIALVFNIDMSGSMAWSFDGTERPALLETRSRLGTVVQAIKDLLQAFADDGFGAVTRVRFQPFTDTFSEGDARTFEDLSDLEAVGEYLDSIVAGGFTRYEPVLQATALWLGDPRNRAAHNIVYLLSDGSDATGFDPIGGGIREVYQGYNAPGRPSLRIYAYGLGQGSDDLEPEQMGELFQPIDVNDPLLPTSGGIEVESQLIRVTAGANLFAVLAETIPILDAEDDGALADTGAPPAEAAERTLALLMPPHDPDSDTAGTPRQPAGPADADVARQMEDLRRRMDEDLGDAPPVVAAAAAAAANAIALSGPGRDWDDDPYAPPPPLPDDLAPEQPSVAAGVAEVSGFDGLSERLNRGGEPAPGGAPARVAPPPAPPAPAAPAAAAPAAAAPQSTGGGRVFTWDRDHVGTALRPSIEVIADFRAGDRAVDRDADVINLGQLVPKGLTNDSLDIDQYVRIGFVGNDLEIQVDVDGARDGFQPQLIVVLPDMALGRSHSSTSSTLRQLIGDGNLTVERNN
ncbi:MAG: type I secretion C-terminal target domain-containing protein [Rhodospirillaceae bacterium]|nr:type I secretion C-terminal target domain-containing protein [Rhodospirillaceae bacterium]